MGLRGETHPAGFSFSNTLTCTPVLGSAAGDYSYYTVSWSNGGGSGVTITSADGATLLGTLTGANATQSIFRIPYSVLNTNVFNANVSDWCAYQLVGLTGRSGAETFVTPNAYTGAYQSPIANITYAGGIAAAGDDVLILGGLDPNNSDTWTYTGGTSTAGAFTDLPGVTNGQNAQTLAQYLLNVSAGATGSISLTANGTPSFISADFAAIVLGATASGGGGGGLMPWFGEQDTQRAQGRSMIVVPQNFALPPLSAVLKKMVPDVQNLRAMPPPARVLHVETLPKRAPPKSWPADVSFARALPPPLRAVTFEALPLAIKYKAGAQDTQVARAMPPPLRATQVEALPAPIIAAVVGRVQDVQASRALPGPSNSTQVEALPGIAGALVRHAPDVSFARCLPAPGVSTNDNPALPRVAGALVQYAPDVSFARACAGPTLAANESPTLPRPAGALAPWAADVPNSTQGARPTQVTHTETPPGLPGAVARFAPDVSFARVLPGPARAWQDVPVPRVSSATVPAPRVTDWNYLRMMPPPTRVTHDPQPTRSPFFLVVPWAPDVSFARALPGPALASHDWTLPALVKAPVRVQDVHYARAMPAPSRVQHDVVVPGTVIDWACDVHFSRVLPGPARVAQDQTLPRPIVLARFAPDVDFARALPAPTRVTHDWTLPGIALARYVPDVAWQRQGAHPTRVTHDFALGPPLRLVSWVADWNYARGLPGPGVSAYPEVYGHLTLGLFDPGTTLYATVTVRLTESLDATPVQLTYLRGVSVYPRGRNKY